LARIATVKAHVLDGMRIDEPATTVACCFKYTTTSALRS